MEGARRVEVALPVPVPRTFTYSLPQGLPCTVGARVLVPFRRGVRIGWLLGPDSREPPGRLRAVLDVIDDQPSLTPELDQLTRWIGDYYIAPQGLAIRTALPSVLSDHSRDVITRTDRVPTEDLTTRESQVLDAIAGGRSRSVTGVRRELGLRSVWSEVRSLRSRGLIRHDVRPPKVVRAQTRKVVRIRKWLSALAEREKDFARAPKQREAYERLEDAGGGLDLAALRHAGVRSATVRALERKGIVVVTDEEIDRDPFRERPQAEAPRHSPTPDQERAVEALRSALDDPDRRPFLLHGVTGSGKTLVYLELLESVLEADRGAIVLVPEISLTPQTVSRFRARFGAEVAVLHSALSDGERYDAWRALRDGRKRIAIGARSAVFAPVVRLGAVVVDEEHDGSYKQSDAPRYHARDLAIVRASLSGAVCVLGSATPSLESWQNARREKYALLSMPSRVAGGSFPSVHVVDLRAHRSKRDGGVGETRTDGGGRGDAGLVLSPPLVEAVRGRLDRREQVILLLNRRGYSNFVQCLECGEVTVCTDCAISLTFHRSRDRLICHHCGREVQAPRLCGRCGSSALSYRGLGTEQVERVVAHSFPGARIARMDVDTTGSKWAHQEILAKVGKGEVDILLGTQMIAKGLDFPRVTLVGVVNADVGLHLPDFRATERTFQLLSQVAGRTGRGPLGGEVLIQTSVPSHYAIQHVVDHDYVGFADRESDERRGPEYPPFTRLVNIVVSSPDEWDAARSAEGAAQWVQHRLAHANGSVRLTGPAPSPIERLHGRWRWHILLRSVSPRALGALTKAFAEGFKAQGGDVRVAIDRDPVALL